MSAYPVTPGLRSLGVGQREAVGGSLCAPCNWAAGSLPDCVPGVVCGCAMVFQSRRIPGRARCQLMLCVCVVVLLCAGICLPA